jgi:predicted esterase
VKLKGFARGKIIMNKIFFVDSLQLDRIRESPSRAWDDFPATKIDLWEIPELENDLENLWEIDFIPCYSEQYFCILVRINQTDMKARDRAYQNGGGFVFQLAQIRDNNELSDVFTVFGTSPLEEREQLKWSRFFVYYKDIDLVFKKAEDGVIVVEKDDEYTYMLVMAPWHYADPLGPFLTKSIGFNIIVPQPINAKHPVQYYSLIPGWKIMAEQELRDYVVYDLEDPRPPEDGFEVECSLDNKYHKKGEPITIHLGLNASSDMTLDASVVVNDETVADKELVLSQGMNTLQLEFHTESHQTGRIPVTLNLAGKSYGMEVLIVDSERIFKIEKRVAELSKQKTNYLQLKESLVTVEWMLELLEKKLQSLKPHQAPWHIQGLIDRLERSMQRVESGESLFVRNEPLKLGMRSELDGTLQPYSLYIPSTFEEGTSGLLIMLHGSGTNDERFLEGIGPLNKYDKTRMMVVAPFARGESHMFIPEESLLDIIEVTEKLMELFSIPQEKIVLGGFSMGGTGVLGAYLKRPDLFQNLMIISGDMKARDNMEIAKDYTTEDSLKQLAQANLIIFHGADDINVNYAELKPVHERLLELNPDIEIHIAEGFGHQMLPDWEEKMMRFIERVNKT